PGEASPIPFATDFSGMGMAAFALKLLLPEDGRLKQVWACDIWKEATGFIAKNHVVEALHADVRERPLPGPPVTIYVAVPPCQPWARCGRGLGVHDDLYFYFLSKQLSSNIIQRTTGISSSKGSTI
ncbi:MAG: hypothetical protein ACKPKO_35640, partial [Candidatus Fonsibacter sp.]